MNNTSGGTELVARWRNGSNNSPAGPLFTSGEFAEADIINASAKGTSYSICSGSDTVQCC
jgi:hypothetical protein